MNNAGWVEYDTQNNDTATATKAAASGKQHIIYAVGASFASTIADKTLTIKDGTTTIWQHTFSDSLHREFPAGIAITPGAAVSAELEAAGSAVIGNVTLHGRTI